MVEMDLLTKMHDTASKPLTINTVIGISFNYVLTAVTTHKSHNIHLSTSCDCGRSGQF